MCYNVNKVNMELLGITGTEYIGYLASFMVLLSFTMKDVKKLRLVNMTGCILYYNLWFFNANIKNWTANNYC